LYMNATVLARQARPQRPRISDETQLQYCTL
jgi:hypothetical protein